MFELRAISVGVIITRTDALEAIFDTLGRGSRYVALTAHMAKLLARISGGVGFYFRNTTELDRTGPPVGGFQLSYGRHLVMTDNTRSRPTSGGAGA